MRSQPVGRNNQHLNYEGCIDFFLVGEMTNRTHRSPQWEEYRWEVKTNELSSTVLEGRREEERVISPPLWGQLPGWCCRISADAERIQSHHSQQLLKEQVFSIHSKENYVCETRKLCGCKFSNLVIISDPFQ